MSTPWESDHAPLTFLKQNGWREVHNGMLVSPHDDDEQIPPVELDAACYRFNEWGLLPRAPKETKTMNHRVVPPSLWQQLLDDERWPHMRLMRVLFATAKGHEYQTWIFRSAESLFAQEKFWTHRFDTMRRHDDRTKGKMPVVWREVTHEVIWC